VARKNKKSKCQDRIFEGQHFFGITEVQQQTVIIKDKIFGKIQTMELDSEKNQL